MCSFITDEEDTDGLEIHFAHAVNTVDGLCDNLSKEGADEVHIIETDVQWSEVMNKAVLAHDEDEDGGDVDAYLDTLHKHWDTNINSGKRLKVCKLDFKKFLAVEPVLLNVRRHLVKDDKLMSNPPLWINADILPTSVSSSHCTRGLVGKDFIETVNSILPGVTLSLGWVLTDGVVDKDKRVVGNVYTLSMMLDMLINVLPLTRPTQHVTFPICAHQIDTSWPLLYWLYSTLPTYFSITFWSRRQVPLSPLTYQVLRSLRHILPHNKVFYDMGDPHFRDRFHRCLEDARDLADYPLSTISGEVLHIKDSSTFDYAAHAAGIAKTRRFQDQKIFLSEVGTLFMTEDVFVRRRTHLGDITGSIKISGELEFIPLICDMKSSPCVALMSFSYLENHAADPNLADLRFVITPDGKLISSYEVVGDSNNFIASSKYRFEVICEPTKITLTLGAEHKTLPLDRNGCRTFQTFLSKRGNSGGALFFSNMQEKIF